MTNFSALDKCLKKYMKEITCWSPERLIHVDLTTLQRLELLDFFHMPSKESQLTRYFQMAETADKITLVNEDFVIWIVPDIIDGSPITYTFIAINENEHPKLELTFMAAGVYNSSKLVMQVLEKFLEEIQENEELINRYKTSS